MDVFNWLKSLLPSKKQNDSEMNLTFSPQIVNNQIPEPTQVFEQSEYIPFPHWLSNEDALRDEGVIFGLSEAKPDEKVKIITSIFEQKLSFYQKKREELSEKISEINLFIEKNHEDLTALQLKSASTMNKELLEENLIRVGVGLAISIGMCFGNYFLIDFSLSQGLPQNHQWISYGVFLTGMFSLFNPLSVLHSEVSKVTWKTALEEFGVPFSASLFVFVQVVENQPIFKSIALLLFVFFMFLVSGKILLSSISKLKSEIRILAKNLEMKANKKLVSTTWREEKVDLEKKIEDLRIDKWRILPELNHTEAEIDKINSEKEALINVFYSEYNLAKSYKNKMSGNQIKNILG